MKRNILYIGIILSLILSSCESYTVDNIISKEIRVDTIYNYRVIDEDGIVDNYSTRQKFNKGDKIEY